MTIKQAIKRRKKLVRQIEKEGEKIFHYNTPDTRVVKKYSTKECLERYIQLSEELVQVKTAIHKATVNIIEIKVKLATLKDLVYNLENLGCISGEWTDERTKEKINYYSEITKEEKLSMISKYETEIEKLEEFLEEFYRSTNI